MLDTVKQIIKELPEEDFNTYYQNYILSIQDENIGLEINSLDNFTDIGRLIGRIRKELSNLQ